MKFKHKVKQKLQLNKVRTGIKYTVIWLVCVLSLKYISIIMPNLSHTVLLLGQYLIFITLALDLTRSQVTQFTQDITDILAKNLTRHQKLTEIQNLLFNQYDVTELHTMLPVVELETKIANLPAEEQYLFYLLRVTNLQDVLDLHGPQMEQLYIQKIIGRLCTLKMNDLTIGKINATDYLLVIKGTNHTTIGNKIKHRVLHSKYTCNGFSITGTGELGVTNNQQSKNLKLALHQAYLSLEASKNSNHLLIYTPNLSGTISSEAILMGMEQKQFFMLYQPQIDVSTFKLSGVEALVRWQHPEFGVISPMYFIPRIEQLGLNVEFGKYIIDSVLQQVLAWKNEDFNPNHIAINVTVDQLTTLETYEYIKDKLDEYGLDPTHIILELTESQADFNHNAVLDALNAIHGLGIQIALDDFGTAHNNLNRLIDLPLDWLKIDKVFVDNIDKSLPLLASIVQLANTLELKITTEGVETLEQVNQIKALGVHSIQGFFFEKPIEAALVPKKYN